MNTADFGSPDALRSFTDGVAEHLSEGAGVLGSPLSDRELAAIAWPGTESWSDLSPQECEAAIRRRLNNDAAPDR